MFEIKMANSRLLDEKTNAIDEAIQFREGVQYLTAETERLMQELNNEQSLRQMAETEVRRLAINMKGYHDDLTPKIDADRREIMALRDLKEIVDRDKDQLKDQV